jgi:ATP-dependent DNA helicase RecG
LEDKVKFHNLGLAIIDEQHRFGVEQRSKLWQKNEIPPHILVMTATPIPRTLAMSLYGD